MKAILATLGLCILGSSALAADSQFGETVKCKIDSINGNLSSYVPPGVGDEITIDTSKGTLQNLDFSSGAMIPVLKPLTRNIHPDTASYMVYFRAIQNDSHIEKGTLTVMVGKFRNESGGLTYSAQIQSVNEEKHSGLLTVADVILSCEPVK